MGRKWEIEQRLQDAVRRKELDMIAKHKPAVFAATQTLYKKWGILTEMVEMAKLNEKLAIINSLRDEIIGKLQKSHPDVHYWSNFEVNAQKEALKTIPEFKDLYALQEKLELAILFASSPKQMVKVYEDFIKEIGKIR